ncbi:Chemotaxis protein CheA [Fundidesulfovibrio magnetotacticus]|uniref:Chemotaxis protein CheA n=1 Tax=Fundidesulfovibrio magnetotacticus TaxID=2730080 RepID=A0A6V8LTY2_9BACT|nr:chemotaxis protein CheA [Fundidesulfovibrio magnetotacticus]GFK95184.1 Chemotaxis protein CheA [Fundidesulfovibrio magnetotacticus]
MNTLGALFQEEQREHLAELDAALLDLDRDPADSGAVDRIFRALHSIKGACDMFGLAGCVALLHDVESLWDRVRCGLSPASRELVDVTLRVKDHLDPVAENGQDLPADLELLAGLEALVAPPAPARPSPPAAQAAARAQDAPTRSLRIRLAPSDPGHFARMDPAALLEELAGLGELHVEADTSGVPALEDLTPMDCRLAWDITLDTAQGADSVRDIFLFLENPGDVVVEDAPASDRAAPGECPGPSTGRPVQAAPPPAANGRPKPVQQAQSLRVEAAKLDNLVNLVGELVIAQARLTQVASDVGLSSLTAVTEEIERLVGELRDNTLSIRMLPIGTTFSRFRRLVRDLCSELGKDIALEAEGGETELDKTVIEQLGDPLVHLLRNSIDHGIEAPEAREAVGKPRQGRIVLSAKQAGGAVVIRIADDGKGLDPARIREKALERGLIAPDVRLSDQECCQLIFAPGFSTAEKVTSVSGRGVGMDVVKRSIEALRGAVEIDSVPGRGAAVTITLPLTLAIIDGLQVRAADEHYIIPLSMVEECVELADGRHSRGRTLHIRGEIVPYVRLRETFLLPGEHPGLEQVVITRHENGRTGIAVDEVVGQQQTVIKSLGRLIGRVEGISGATINGDGSMALILDVPQLVASVLRETGADQETSAT